MGLCKMVYGNSSFRIPDLDMQLMFYYIYEEMLKVQYHFAFKETFLAATDFLVKGYAFGELWLSWNKFLQTEQESGTMVGLFENVKIHLQNKGPEISAEEIEAIAIDDSHFKMFLESPFPVSKLIRIAEHLYR